MVLSAVPDEMPKVSMKEKQLEASTKIMKTSASWIMNRLVTSSQNVSSLGPLRSTLVSSENLNVHDDYSDETFGNKMQQ